MRKNGFSFIELIVVMTIIVVISTVALVNYTGSSKKARDTRRVSDLEKIRMSLEIARQTGATYPQLIVGLETGNYLSKLPVDPKTNINYRYIPTADYFNYTLDSKMEDLGSTNGDWGLGYNYRVTNL